VVIQGVLVKPAYKQPQPVQINNRAPGITSPRKAPSGEPTGMGKFGSLPIMPHTGQVGRLVVPHMRVLVSVRTGGIQF
jgi:hypothetical protein